MNSWFQPLLALSLTLLLSFSQAWGDSRVVSLGTGGVTGLYYPTGGAVCRLVNLTRPQHGIRCAVQSTSGSISNLEQVASGELDVAIAEAGHLHQAVLKGNSTAPLRSLVSLFPEYISVLVRTDAGIDRFADLRGKRLNIGQPDSSQRLTLERLMANRGWQPSEFAELTVLEPAQQAQALCDNRIDASLYVVGHPSGAIKEAIRDCRSKLISLDEADIAALVELNPYYRLLRISSAYYGTETADVTTVGVDATLFARADLPDQVAYSLVKSLFEQFDRFQRMHPAFRDLQPRQMVSNRMAAPLHPGAERYFREAGLLD